MSPRLASYRALEAALREALACAEAVLAAEQVHGARSPRTHEAGARVGRLRRELGAVRTLVRWAEGVERPEGPERQP